MRTLLDFSFSTKIHAKRTAIFPALVIKSAVRMLSEVNAKIFLPLILLAVFALSRWPGLMPQNFSAAYAIAFCAGLYLPKRLAWWIPLLVLLATDLAMNLFFYRVTAFHLSMLGNYLAFAAIIWMGTRFSARDSWLKLLGGGVLGAILFYFITNTMSWLLNPFQNPEYTKNMAGWLIALTKGTAGWPQTVEFFRNTLLSGGLFTGLFVAAMKIEEASESAAEKEAPAGESEEPGEETAT